MSIITLPEQTVTTRHTQKKAFRPKPEGFLNSQLIAAAARLLEAYFFSKAASKATFDGAKSTFLTN